MEENDAFDTDHGDAPGVGGPSSPVHDFGNPPEGLELASSDQATTAPSGATTGTGKSTPPKKAAARKKATKSGTVKKKTTSKKAPVSRRAAVAAQQAKFPRHPVEKSLRVAKAIYEQNAGKPTTLIDAAKFTTGGKAGGPFVVEVSSAKKYGFLRSENGKLVPEDRARKVLFPQSDSDRLTALREAVLGAPDLGEVYSHYRGEYLPDAEFFTNALRDTFKIPADKILEFVDVFQESMRSAQLLDETGERARLIDVGRDDSVKPVAVPGPKRTDVAPDAVCFVMQPFGGHLGTYYETIFKPAIEKAGLSALRADDDIFATGKVMDQVWRGIRRATVLVAEMTSKNPNVFYELGLAHALNKPVVLVSSNEDDVPFDLRHIRVILYDQNDPFWGQKLIDKVADNIKSALTAPEEAIFRVADD